MAPVNRGVERWLSVLGNVAIVFALSQFHGRVIADEKYSFAGTSRFGWAITFLAVLTLTTYAVGLPDQPRTVAQCAGSASIAALGGALGVSLFQLATGDALLPRFVVFATAVAVVPWQVLVNALSRQQQERDGDRDRVLLIATPAERERLMDDLELEPERGATLVGALDRREAVGDGSGEQPILEAQRRTAATVVVIDRLAIADDRVVAQVARLHESGVRVRSLVGFYEEWLGKLPVSELERASLFFDIGGLHDATYTRVKRVVDVALAALGTLLLMALTPFVLLGNAVANRGPLFYRQTRIGKAGKPFTILKFRTMRPEGASLRGAPADGRWTDRDDPRVTPFGRLLRRSHLDELPQVLNIVRGDLAVVGPRPEQPHYVEELAGKLAFYDLRHLVRPGLTGWAQVKYGYAGDERDALEKLQYEFFYLRRQSLSRDARIVARTLRSIVGGRGAGR